MKHCKHSGLRQAPPVTRALSDPISAVLDWSSICLQLLCPHHHQHHLMRTSNLDSEKQDKRTFCFSGFDAKRCVQQLGEDRLTMAWGRSCADLTGATASGGGERASLHACSTGQAQGGGCMRAAAQGHTCWAQTWHIASG